MKYLKRYVILFISVFIMYILVSTFQLFDFVHSDVPLEVVENFEALKHKIDYLEKQIEQKESDINNLKQSFTSNVKYYNELVDKQKFLLTDMRNSKLETILKNHLASLTSNINSNETTVIANNQTVNQQLKDILLMQILSQNMNFSLNDINKLLANSNSNMDVEFKQIIEFLPHLNKNQNVLGLIQPKFKLSKNRYAPYVIGIPTIKREKTSYLLETLKSLFDAMNDLEKTDVLVVVLIAEIDDQAFVQSTIESISKGFRFEVDTGLLDLVVPPIEFYPDLNSLGIDRVFNDSAERVKWRTKQNFDFSYLMTYSWKRGKYYLQLEDDVVSKAGFLSTMKTFVEKQSNNPEWLIIKFSQLGFIGKLFKTTNLPVFVNFFLMFAKDKPCDWLLESVLDVRVCNPEKGDAHCARSKDSLKIKYKPSLFQHVGLQSSLKGKTQKLKDKDFGKQELLVKHNNPSAKCSTSLKTYMKHTLEGAYLGQNVFWAMAPKANDFILFHFDQPSSIYKYYIKSGNPEHPDDKLIDATLQIKPVKEIDDKSKLPSNYESTSDGFLIIDKFSSQLGSVSGEINVDVVGQLSEIRIHIPHTLETWILINEIHFSTEKPLNDKRGLLRK